MREKLKKYTLSLGYLNQFTTSAIGFILTPIYINHFGATEYSIISVIGLLITWSFVCDLGVSININKQISAAPSLDIAKKKFTSALILLCFCVITYILLYFLNQQYFIQKIVQTNLTNQASQITFIIFLVFVTKLVETFLRQTAFGFKCHHEVYIFGILAQTTRHVIQLSLILIQDASFETFLYQYILISILLSCAYALRINSHLKLTVQELSITRHPRALLSETLKKSLPFVLTSSLIPLFTTIDKILILNTFGGQVFAIVSIATALGSLLGILIAPNQQVHFTYINSTNSIKSELKKLQIKTVLLVYTCVFLFVFYLYVGEVNLFEVWGVNHKDATHANALFKFIFFNTLGIIILMFSLNYLSSSENLLRILFPIFAVLYFYLVFEIMGLGLGSISEFYSVYIGSILLFNIIILIFVVKNYSFGHGIFILILMLPCVIFYFL